MVSSLRNSVSGYVQHHLDAVSRTSDARASMCSRLAVVENASRILLEQGWTKEMIDDEATAMETGPNVTAVNFIRK